MENFDLARVLKYLPGIILGLTVHEFSHALVANICGDSTAKDEGRITLNPLKHIDLLGFIMLIAVGFGWAKPVVFNEQKLRNPKYDIVKIAAAGPLSNALIAIILSVIFSFLYRYLPAIHYGNMRVVTEVFLYAIYINWGLFIFNLIPVPPLDGSHLLFNGLKKYPAVHDALYKYGSLLFFGLIVITMVTKIDLIPIGPAIRFLGDGFLSIVGFR
jgi:Zn-dependent protease